MRRQLGGAERISPKKTLFEKTKGTVLLWERKKEVLMKYFKVPNHVFDLNLTPIEFCVLCCLLKCRNSVTGKCFPSYNRIANDCHISRSSVARAVKALKEKGMIRVRYNYENHIQRNNSYEIGL